MRNVVSHNEEETFNLGKVFGKTSFPGMIVLLYGDLGAGKTVFTKGIAKGIGIRDMINSPTYTIIHVHYGNTNLYHFDLYRIGTEQEFFDIGGYEYIEGDGICVVEWAERIDWDDYERLEVVIKHSENEDRQISFVPYGEKYENWLKSYAK